MSRRTLALIATCFTLFGVQDRAVGQPQDGLPPASIAVSPPRVEVDLDAGRSTQSVQLINLSDKATTISVSVTNWDLDEHNKVRDVPPTEQSLDQWIVINPLEFTIAPNEQQTVRFAVRPRLQPAQGEHRAMIYFEQQPADTESDAASVSIRYRLGVTVYGLSGHIDRRGRILAIRHTTSGEDHFLDVDAISEGNASVRLKGRYAVWRADDFPGAEAAAALLDPRSTPATPPGVGGLLPEIPILPGTERTIRVRLPRFPDAAPRMLYVSGELTGRAFAQTLEIAPP